ncbi:MAG: hypothetical protein LCH38_06955 [Proteobacteria bacterium]|nr:hypothetical protein [Pseudomonadota bacterium]
MARKFPFLLMVLPCALASTAKAEETLSGAEIRKLFTDATVAGTYAHGGAFSEFHAVDGRALGDNGYTINVDACWNTDGDAICYHYGALPDRRTYCFTVARDGEMLSLRVAATGRLNARARVTPGNPQNHGDGGRRWSCDDLLAARGHIRAAALVR